MPPGTAIATAPNQGLLIDQAGAPPDVTVAFDINTGWDAGEKPYAQVIPARTKLVPLIAEYSQELAFTATNSLTVGLGFCGFALRLMDVAGGGRPLGAA
jgi:hypothetical protein